MGELFGVIISVSLLKVVRVIRLKLVMKVCIFGLMIWWCCV